MVPRGSGPGIASQEKKFWATASRDRTAIRGDEADQLERALAAVLWWGGAARLGRPRPSRRTTARHHGVSR